MRGRYGLIMLLVVMVAVIVACAPEPPPEPTATPVPTVHPGKAIVKSRCISCHDIGRVTGHKDDLDGWTLTVDRMVLLGASLPEDKRDLVIDYLAYTYPEE